jgi:methyl-accepting chemotaxis protein
VATGSQVKVASESLSSASQQLASSSQEQAASVEEVSASLEEISGMVTSSLKGAKDSVDHSKHVTELVIEGAEAMAALQTAVNQIAESNQRVEQLAKLIEEIGAKSELIDEIVFQTRLLSFNASVEAERAGEHGRGFAVVAQEVGNLAQMSGKSAAEIGQIVKSSIKEAQAVSQENRLKVEQGVSICKTTANKLEVIRKASEDILNGSQQILRASEEQSAGVQQINQSIQLISQTTQGNASAAEECADNSRALSDQSVNLENVVTELGRFVSGRSDSKPNNVIEFKKRESEEKGGEVKIQSQSFSGERKKKFSLRSGSTAVAASNDLWEDI